MIRVTAARLQKRYGHYSSLAREGEVVVVTSHGNDRTVLISIELLRELAVSANRLDLLSDDARDQAKTGKTGKTGKKLSTGASKSIKSSSSVKFPKSPISLPYAGVVKPDSTDNNSFAIAVSGAGGEVIDEEPPAF